MNSCRTFTLLPPFPLRCQSHSRQEYHSKETLSSLIIIRNTIFIVGYRGFHYKILFDFKTISKINTVHITTGFIYSIKLRRCIFPVKTVDFHFVENDQKNSLHTTRLFSPDATKNQHKHYVLRPHYVLLKLRDETSRDTVTLAAWYNPDALKNDRQIAFTVSRDMRAGLVSYRTGRTDDGV